jgi:hypothetical protein
VQRFFLVSLCSSLFFSSLPIRHKKSTPPSACNHQESPKKKEEITRQEVKKWGNKIQDRKREKAETTTRVVHGAPLLKKRSRVPPEEVK